MTKHDNIEEVRAQLPWYVNGTLDTNTRQSVADAIAKSPALKAEVEWLEALQSNIKEDTTSNNVAADIGMDKFKALISNEQSGKMVNISRWQQWQRPLMAVAATVFMVQMGVIGTLLNNQPETITTLSGQKIVVSQDMALLQIVFKDAATALEVQSALNTIQAEIVGGPSALGVYTVSVSKQNVRKDIASLRQHTAIESVAEVME